MKNITVISLVLLSFAFCLVERADAGLFFSGRNRSRHAHGSHAQTPSRTTRPRPYDNDRYYFSKYYYGFHSRQLHQLGLPASERGALRGQPW